MYIRITIYLCVLIFYLQCLSFYSVKHVAFLSFCTWQAQFRVPAGLIIHKCIFFWINPAKRRSHIMTSIPNLKVCFWIKIRGLSFQPSSNKKIKTVSIYTLVLICAVLLPKLASASIAINNNPKLETHSTYPSYWLNIHDELRLSCQCCALLVS